MSLRASIAVWDRSTAAGSTRLLLLALADFADEDGYSWPSTATLASRTGRTERQVRRLLGIAIDAGELQADRRGGHSTSRYRLTPGGQYVGEGGHLRPPLGGRTPATTQGGHGRPPREDTSDHPGRTPASTEPSVNHQENHHGSSARELELQDAEQRLRDLAEEPATGPTAAELADAGSGDPVVRYHELTARFPGERIREWLNDVASTWGDRRTADALAEAYRRDTTHRGLIGRAVDVMNEQEHEAERSKREARTPAAAPPPPEQSDEERARILEANAARAREARAQLLADGLVAPTRDGDRELLAEEIERRRTAGAPA